jgi:hypothetical protein
MPDRNDHDGISGTCHHTRAAIAASVTYTASVAFAVSAAFVVSAAFLDVTSGKARHNVADHCHNYDGHDITNA